MHIQQTHGTTRRGFSYIEILLAGMITTIGLAGYAASLVATADLGSSTTETARAMNVARFAIEEIESIGNIDYAINNLNGFSFTIPNLQAPKMDKPFPDGTFPSFYRSSTLPPAKPPVTSPPTGYPPVAPPPEDAALNVEYEGQPIALQPATSSDRAFGTVRVDSTNPNLVMVEVTIQFSTSRGNRNIRVHSQLIRPVDPSTFDF